MVSIIIVAGKNKESYFSFLKEMYPCDLNFVEYSHVAEVKRLLVNEKNILILDATDKERFKSFLASDLRIETNALVIVAGDMSQVDNPKDYISDFGVKGMIDYSKDSRFMIPMFRLIFDRNKDSIDLEDLNQIYRNLKEIGESTSSELKRIKRIHEKLVPLRRNRLNGIDIMAKYSAGEKIGGEFFDFIEIKGQLLFILASTNSYISSNIVMESFEKMRNEPEFALDDLKSFISNFYALIDKKEIPEVNKEVEMLMAVIDTRTLDFWGVNVGTNSIVSNKQSIVVENENKRNGFDIDSLCFSTRLMRGEACTVFSAGAKKNCRGLLDGRPWEREVQKYLEGGIQETLSEIFYRLKREREDSFLEEDATAIVFEVNKNAIIQV